MRGLEKAVLILTAIGAINWALYTLEYDLVELIFGSVPTIANVVYWVIAICGIYALAYAFK